MHKSLSIDVVLERIDPLIMTGSFMKKLNLWILTICITLLASCAIVYKTHTIGENIKKIETDLDSQIKKTVQSLKPIKRYWAVVNKSTKIPRQKTYQSAQKNMNKLLFIIEEELPKELRLFKKYSAEKWKFIQEKKEIQKSDPRYQSYLDIKKYTEDLSLRLSEKNEQAQKYFHALKKYFKSLNIYEVNPKKLDADVNKSLAQMDQQIKQVKTKLDLLRANVEKDPQPNRKRQRKKVITKMGHILQKIEIKKVNFQPLLDRFRKETADKNSKIIVLPEMASHTILRDIEKLIKEIREQGRQFNSRIEELKALN